MNKELINEVLAGARDLYRTGNELDMVIARESVSNLIHSLIEERDRDQNVSL